MAQEWKQLLPMSHSLIHKYIILSYSINKQLLKTQKCNHTINWPFLSATLQYSCLEKSMDRGTWLATVHRVAKSQTLKSAIKDSVKEDIYLLISAPQMRLVYSNCTYLYEVQLPFTSLWTLDTKFCIFPTCLVPKSCLTLVQHHGL